MLKGISKNVVVLKGNNDEFYDEAIFILKPTSVQEDNKNILKQAQKIIDDHNKHNLNKRQQKYRFSIKTLLFFGFMCFALAFISCYLVFIL